MTVLANIKSKIATAFEKIGRTNGTAQPTTEDNTFALAYEYYCADQLAAMAAKRKEQAKAACEQAGLLEHAAIIGSTEVTYDSDFLTISARTATPTTGVDKTVLQNELVKALGAEKAQKVMKAVIKTNKPAVTYIFSAK